MATLKQIKSQIKAIEKTSQITKAMYAISFSKIKKAEEAFVNFTNYEIEFEEIFNVIKYELLDYFKEKSKKAGNKNIYVLISSDRGLAGSFHNNLFSFFSKRTEKGKNNSYIFTIGRKAHFFAKKNKYNLLNNEVIFNRDDMHTVNLGIIANAFEKAYHDDSFKKIAIFYQNSLSQFTYEPQEEIIFPIKDDRSCNRDISENEYILEDEPEIIYTRLLYKYLETKIYKALLSSNQSEHAARLLAMKSATDNADEAREKLSLKFNRVRQHQITNELIDVINGSKLGGK